MVSKVATTPHSTSAATTHFHLQVPGQSAHPPDRPVGVAQEGGAPREAPQQEQRGDGRRQVGGPEEVVLHVPEVVRQEGVEQRRGPGGDGTEPQVAEHGERDHHQQPEPHQVVEVQRLARRVGDHREELDDAQLQVLAGVRVVVGLLAEGGVELGVVQVPAVVLDGLEGGLDEVHVGPERVERLRPVLVPQPVDPRGHADGDRRERQALEQDAEGRRRGLFVGGALDGVVGSDGVARTRRILEVDRRHGRGVYGGCGVRPRTPLAAEAAG